MKLLLDTHTFLWWDGNKQKLPKQVLTLIEDEGNEIFLSLVSVWEMQIKHQLGKLLFQASLAEIIKSQKENNGIILLPIALSHILKLQTLPMHHKDPFDRLLATQAIHEGMTF